MAGSCFSLAYIMSDIVLVYDSVIVPVYSGRTVVSKVAVYSAGNDSWSDVVYGKVWDVSYVQKENYKRSGLKVSNIPVNGVYNVYDGKVYKWVVPVGDRNWKEFPACLPYEVEKGVCSDVSVLIEKVNEGALAE